MKVMVIADSVDQAADACHAVTAAGHKAAAFCDGVESLDEFVNAIGAARADVVLLDIAVVGIDAAELVAALASTSSPPAVVLCTDVEASAIRLDEGVVAAVLRKPYSTGELVAFLDAVQLQQVKSSGVRARRDSEGPARRGGGGGAP